MVLNSRKGDTAMSRISREVRHEGLNKFRIVYGETDYEVDQKVEALKAQWDEQWERKQSQEKKRKEREEKRVSAELSQIAAKQETIEAEAVQEAIDNYLTKSNDQVEISFLSLKKFSEYPIAEPKMPELLEYPRKPLREDEEYNPEPSFFTKLFKKKYNEFIEDNDAIFREDLEKWEEERDNIDNHNKMIVEYYHDERAKWEKNKEDFLAKQQKENEIIDEWNTKFLKGDISAIEDFYEKAVDSIKYPIPLDTDSEVEYNPANKMLIVDVYLPTQDDLPNLKSVSYIKSKDAFKESYFSSAQMKKKYESFIYQMVLRIFKCVFSINKQYANLESCVINGRISTIDKTTGKQIEPFILSISVTPENFGELNLNAIDPRAWFKSSKGVSAASIADITPIAPIVTMSREDSRFIEGYEVENTLDESVNLAAMDWQDFENLIRELFEEEFRSTGGEVKITQASRDGGVDAVAFDPDPIRGGKIVIQAKRYTNVVGVSAVRDLYGTTLNEGATKGILVTTSNYGNDAYQFAKDKPLTLINGAQLLYLLQKHGHSAKIDLKEAKEIFKTQE